MTIVRWFYFYLTIRVGKMAKNLEWSFLLNGVILQCVWTRRTQANSSRKLIIRFQQTTNMFRLAPTEPKEIS